MTKMGQKLIKKIAQNCVVFFTFSVYILLKFLRLVDWGRHGPSSLPRLRPCFLGAATVVMVQHSTVVRTTRLNSNSIRLIVSLDVRVSRSVLSCHKYSAAMTSYDLTCVVIIHADKQVLALYSGMQILILPHSGNMYKIKLTKNKIM